jgi:hypothetical protein
MKIPFMDKVFKFFKDFGVEFIKDSAMKALQKDRSKSDEYNSLIKINMDPIPPIKNLIGNETPKFKPIKLHNLNYVDYDSLFYKAMDNGQFAKAIEIMFYILVNIPDQNAQLQAFQKYIQYLYEKMPNETYLLLVWLTNLGPSDETSIKNIEMV